MSKAGASCGGSSPCMAAVMRQATRKLTQLYDTVLEPSGLRITQYSILCELERCDGGPSPTLQELGRTLVMERSALGQTLRPLERDGFIAFGQDEADQRRRPVVLTKAGRDVLSQARPLWDIAQAQFFSAFGAEESVVLRETLRGIAHDDRLSTARA
jgi:DNA-binding MarR family transcriptional regulator